MKTKYYKIALLLLTALAINACTAYEDAADAKKVVPLTINLKTDVIIPGLADLSNLKVTLNNYDEGLVIEKPFAVNMTIGGLIPGVYDILISGQAEDSFGRPFTMSGSLEKTPLLIDGEELRILLDGAAPHPLVFKEIYYCGVAPFWFRDQFYEIYNNSFETVYLDGLFFANLQPTADTSTRPLWPEEDGNKYVYAATIWKVPGNGTDYPLAAGESFVIAQLAVNHKLAIYNPDSPMDNSSAEFEFNCNNPNFPDQPAYDMIHFCTNGRPEYTLPQYLTPVFGGAYVIFHVPEGEEYDPLNNPELVTRDLSTTSNTVYAKIPITYIYDGVEAIRNDAAGQNKRMPAILDAGYVTVGDTYIGQGVARKCIGYNPDGTPVLQDTNNSTADFDRNVIPQLRRYGSKMPSWNHTLINK